MAATNRGPSAHTIHLRSSQTPSKERRHSMNKLLKFLAAFAVACMLVGFASPASAQCNPTDKSSKSACFTSCNSCAGPFQGACKAQCANIGDQIQTKFCAKEGVAVPVAEWSSERCDKGPQTKKCPGGKVVPIDQDCPPQGGKTKKCWNGTVIPVEQDCPPQGGDNTPKCGANEEPKDGGCVCKSGFEKNVCDGPCVAVCAEGQIRNTKGECVDGNGGPCEDPCPGFAKTVQETDHLWLLIAILLGVFGHLGWHLWFVYGRKSKDDKDAKPAKQSKPKDESSKPAKPKKPAPAETEVASADEPLFGGAAADEAEEEDEFEEGDEAEEPKPKPEPEPEPKPKPKTKK